MAASFISNQTCNVAYWPSTDLTKCLLDDRYRGISGLYSDIVNVKRLTHNGHRGGCQFALQQTWRRLLDDLIGGHKQALWNFEAERLCGLEVDDKLELGRLHDR